MAVTVVFAFAALVKLTFNSTLTPARLGSIESRAIVPTTSTIVQIAPIIAQTSIWIGVDMASHLHAESNMRFARKE